VDRDQGVDEQRVPVIHDQLNELYGDVAFRLRFARGQVVQAQVTAHNPAGAEQKHGDREGRDQATNWTTTRGIMRFCVGHIG
jgi:hypothetical protein